MSGGTAPFQDERYRHVTGWVGWHDLAAPAFEGATGTLAPALHAVIGGMKRNAVPSGDCAVEAKTLTDHGWRAEPGRWPKDQRDHLEGQLGAWSAAGSWKRNNLVAVKAIRLQDDRVAVGVSQAHLDAYKKILDMGGIVAKVGGKLPFAWVELPWQKGADAQRWKKALTILDEALQLQ